jgi:hypothetical protein
VVNAITNFSSLPFASEILSLFIGKINLSFASQLLGFQANFVIKQLKIILILHFFSLHFWSFCPYIMFLFFYIYFYIFLKSNVIINLIRKINNDFEMSALKTECIENKFLNFKFF